MGFVLWHGMVFGISLWSSVIQHKTALRTQGSVCHSAVVEKGDIMKIERIALYGVSLPMKEGS
ncbi:MAG: hypothetical protein P8R39_02940, partial [Alphaproteobacteria bacterium]|nr:hypothetical protein [Alphaproteobacteria bacterium]